MNKNLFWGGVALLLAGSMGCGTNEVPVPSVDRAQSQSHQLQLTTVRLRIDGFMKSKSGAT